MPNRADGPSEHVPLKAITAEGLLRAVEAEAEALRIIHVRIHKQLQNLEVEEKLLQHMINRTRSRHSEQELQQFDEQYERDKALRQQQQQQQQRMQRQQQQQATQASQAAGQPAAGGSQLQQLLLEHPLLDRHRRLGSFRNSDPATGPQQQQQQHGEQQQQQQHGEQQQQQLPPQPPGEQLGAQQP